jgi:hypothetical protein
MKRIVKYLKAGSEHSAQVGQVFGEMMKVVQESEVLELQLHYRPKMRRPSRSKRLPGGFTLRYGPRRVLVIRFAKPKLNKARIFVTHSINRLSKGKEKAAAPAKRA